MQYAPDFCSIPVQLFLPSTRLERDWRGTRAECGLWQLGMEWRPPLGFDSPDRAVSCECCGSDGDSFRCFVRTNADFQRRRSRVLPSFLLLFDPSTPRRTGHSEASTASLASLKKRVYNYELLRIYSRHEQGAHFQASSSELNNKDRFAASATQCTTPALALEDNNRRAMAKVVSK